MGTWGSTRTIVGAAALALSACSSTHTSFTSTWKPGDARPVSAAGKKVAVVFINQNPGTRRVGEDAMANEVARVGAVPIESYTIMPEKPPEQERARKVLERSGADVLPAMSVAWPPEPRPASPSGELRFAASVTAPRSFVAVVSAAAAAAEMMFGKRTFTTWLSVWINATPLPASTADHRAFDGAAARAHRGSPVA